MRQILLSILVLLIVACSGTKKSKQSGKDNTNALFTVNNTAVYPDEFIYAYNKSSKNKGERDPVEDYLELYVNFKLKVEDAKKEGIDTLPSYKNELSGYLKDVKKPYLVTEKVNEALLEETYNRLQQEVNASHILIKLDPEASPADTLEAYNKIVAIKKRYNNGESFTKLAEQYSEDPSAQVNKGSLGWFTAFQMVYPFENAAYNTPKGEVSDIVKTQFGYHILKVNDKRETSGRIKISHIMLRFPPKGSKEDSLAVRGRIYEIHNKLMEGEPWFAAATKYSEDLKTKDNGGSLPWFGVGNLPPEMEKAAFKLSQPEQISSPIKTDFGWHIIKLEDKRGMGTLESMRESLVRRIQRDQRSSLKEAEVIEKLKAENNFVKNEGVYAQMRTQKELNTETISDKLKEEILFSIAEENYTVQKFLKSVGNQKSFKEAIKKYEQESILDYEDRHLVDKYPDYRLLSNEYRDGLLLFEIMNRKVWSKVSNDTLGMKKYYEDHKADYYSPTKAKADIFILKDTSELRHFKAIYSDSLYTLVGEISLENLNSLDYLRNYTTPIYTKVIYNKKDSSEMAELSDKLKMISKNLKPFEDTLDSDKKGIYLQLFTTASDILGEQYSSVSQIESGEFNLEDLFEEQHIPSTIGSYVVSDENQFQLINIHKIVPSRPQTFKEAKSKLLVDYQQYLEDQWIEELRAENTISINPDVLEKVKREIEE